GDRRPHRAPLAPARPAHPARGAAPPLALLDLALPLRSVGTPHDRRAALRRRDRAPRRARGLRATADARRRPLEQRRELCSRGGLSDRLFDFAATALLPLHSFDAFRTPFGPGHAFDEIGVALTQAGLPLVDLPTGVLFLAAFVLVPREARLRPAFSYLAALAL